MIPGFEGREGERDYLRISPEPPFAVANEVVRRENFVLDRGLGVEKFRRKIPLASLGLIVRVPAQLDLVTHLRRWFFYFAQSESVSQRSVKLFSGTKTVAEVAAMMAPGAELANQNKLAEIEKAKLEAAKPTENKAA